MPNRKATDKAGLALLAVLLSLLLGCQTTSERLIAQGYPRPFATGFDDGCGSGRQAGGALGEFRKNVPAYLNDRQYAAGWDDGFRQCQATTVSDFERQRGVDTQADRDWKRDKDQARARALRH